MTLACSVIVCAYNEEGYLASCLHSLLAQSRPADEILVVNNASTDRTASIGASIAGVHVVDEPERGLLRARERGRRAARGDVLAYIDADCRAPLGWLQSVERAFDDKYTVAVSGPYRFYDWDMASRLIVRAYDLTLAPVTHTLVQHVFALGAILYGGNFAVRADALRDIGGFDLAIDFHGEDTNLGRRLAAIGRVRLAPSCYVHTSARRYRAMGRGRVASLYVRNFVWEIFRHQPADRTHQDIRSR
jgi:glycosyltransferase involved in cell wall biosynthesis